MYQYKRHLIEYLPDFLRSVREYKAILTDAIEPEVVELFQTIENALNDQFIETAGEYGISRWEKMLKIVPKSTQTLDDRRFTILTKMNEQPPFTMNALKQKLENLCGKDGYSVEVDVEKYILKVRIALKSRNAFDDVCVMLERVVPSNMIIDVSLMYNQHKAFMQYTNDQLTAYTHHQLRNEVMNNG